MLWDMLLLFLACSTPTPKPATPPPHSAPTFDYSARAPVLNVILVSLDATRWDHTGLGGAATTPNLDAFAKDAVVFTPR